MLLPLPSTTLEFLKWTWPQIEPYFINLETRPLNESTLSQWMKDWGALGKHMDEAYWRLWADTTLDTLNEPVQQRFERFLADVQEPAHAAEHRLRQKLLASGLRPEHFNAPLRNMAAEASIFREENLPLLTEEHRLGNEYDRLRSVQSVMWEGDETTLTQLLMVNHDHDRAKREEAWRAGMARFLDDRDALNDLWVKVIRLRHRIALNAGLPDYRAYRWRQMLRLDYTPQDCETFHHSIEEVVVPAAKRVLERQRQNLGIETLRPWDIEVQPPDYPPLHPFQTVNELENHASTIFHALDPHFGEQFDTLRREGLLDLDNRVGKMPSSYCATFGVQQRPFVFMDVVGSHDDVMTLFHECGHAFHTFEFASLPHHAQLRIGTEFHEVAAIAMELLAAPYLSGDHGGFYSEADAARARIRHLETMLLWWPYIAVVDAFQHWVYTHIEAACHPANCDAKWAELWSRFMPGEDWSGLDEEMKTGWHRKLHIFRSPLYYVDYGLAQLGAVQIWERAIADQHNAIAQYRHALSLGGTVSLPELFESAGAKLAFDAPSLAEAVALIERTIDELSAQT
jgi:oligoendopeptidase F